MDEKCLICQEINDPETYVFLGEVMDKFENLMEGSEFDLNSIKNALICKNCENKIDTFFDFKSCFVEKEDELLNYVDENHRVDLCAMLVANGTLEKKDYHSTLRVCRICFKTSEESNFKEIRTCESDITKLTTCYPDFDIFLTGTTYVCPECESKVLKFHDFYLSCFNAIKNVTVLEDPLSLDIEFLTRERNLKLEAQEIEECPPVPTKRKRGRPRKFEEIDTENKYISKENERIIQEAKAEKRNLYYECQVCPGIFDSLESLLNHIQFHEKQRKLICWQCGDIFQYLHFLRIHFYEHGMDIFKVVVQEREKSDNEENNDKTNTKRNFRNRRTRKVNDTSQHIECQLCLEKFRNLRSFQKHIEYHENVKEFHCLKCTYSSNLITDIQRHLATSHQIRHLYKVIHSDVEETHVNKTKKDLLPTTSNSLYRCGACSGIFFDLNELDDHTCTVQATEGSLNTPFESKTDNGGNSSVNPLVAVQSLDSNQNGERYECEFCSFSFKTLTALDNHECQGDEGSSSYSTKHKSFKCFMCNLEFESCAALATHNCGKFGPTVDLNCSIDSVENINEKHNKLSPGQLNFATKNGDQIRPSNCSSTFESYTDLVDSCDSQFFVKTEEQFHCSYCNAALETPDELNLHNCNKDSFSSKSEVHPEEPNHRDVNNRFAMKINKHCGDVMLCVQKNGGTPSGEIGCNAMHCDSHVHSETANDWIINKDESVKAPIKEKPNRKEVINRIASMFGVQIVEGDNRERENIANEFGCVGCDFKAPKKKDILIHVSYCEKVKKCIYCPYRTNLSQKLELHSYVVHGEIVYSCSSCRFLTSMEENFESHMSIHSGMVEIDKSWEEQTSEKDYGSHCAEFEDKINIEMENVSESVHDEIDVTSEIEYIGDIFLCDKDRGLDNSAEVFDPLRLDILNAHLNEGTLLSRKQKYGGETSLEYVNETEESNRLSTVQMPESKTDINDTHSASESVDQESRDHSESYMTCSDSSPSRIITEDVPGNTDVIDINSDSDNEFIESSDDRATIVGEIRTVDFDEASHLISQGIPVVKNSDLLRMHVETSAVNSDVEITEAASEMDSNDGFANFGLSLNTSVIEILKEAVKKHNMNKETRNQQLCLPKTYNTEQNSSVFVGSDVDSQTNQESDSDCVIVPNKADQQRSRKFSKTRKNPNGHSSDTIIVKRPPNAFNIFFERFKKAIEKKYSTVKGTERRSIIVNIWKNMSHQDKWLYLEEARLRRLLFKREHPELCRPIPRKRKKTSEANKSEEQSNLSEEIMLD